jgi:hypothetical protein
MLLVDCNALTHSLTMLQRIVYRMALPVVGFVPNPMHQHCSSYLMIAHIASYSGHRATSMLEMWLFCICACCTCRPPISLIEYESHAIHDGNRSTSQSINDVPPPRSCTAQRDMHLIHDTPMTHYIARFVSN